MGFEYFLSLKSNNSDFFSKCPELIFLFKKALIYCYITGGEIEKAKSFFNKHFSKVKHLELFKQTFIFFEIIFNNQNKRFINSNFLSSFKNELFSLLENILLILLKQYHTLKLVTSEGSLYSEPLSTEHETFSFLKSELELEKVMIEYIHSNFNDSNNINNLKLFEEYSFIMQESIIYKPFENNKSITEEITNLSEAISLNNRRKSFPQQTSSNSLNSLAFSLEESSYLLSTSFKSTNNQVIKLLYQPNFNFGKIDSNDPNLNLNLLSRKTGQMIEKNKSLRRNNDFLLEFNPKAIKKQNLDKKIIRIFNAYVKQVFDIDGSIGKQHKSTTNNENELSLELQFVSNFAGKKFVPPFVFQNKVFKSYNAKYLAWLFNNRLLRQLYSEFCEEYSKQITETIIQEYNLRENEPLVCKQLHYYITNLASIYLVNINNKSSGFKANVNNSSQANKNKITEENKSISLLNQIESSPQRNNSLLLFNKQNNRVFYIQNTDIKTNKENIDLLSKEETIKHLLLFQNDNSSEIDIQKLYEFSSPQTIVNNLCEDISIPRKPNENKDSIDTSCDKGNSFMSFEKTDYHINKINCFNSQINNFDFTSGTQIPFPFENYEQEINENALFKTDFI